jgi:hypothetical protein
MSQWIKGPKPEFWLSNCSRDNSNSNKTNTNKIIIIMAINKHRLLTGTETVEQVFNWKVGHWKRVGWWSPKRKSFVRQCHVNFDASERRKWNFEQITNDSEPPPPTSNGQNLNEKEKEKRDMLRNKVQSNIITFQLARIARSS